MFKYKYNNKHGEVEGSVSGQFGIAAELLVRDKFDDGDLIVKVILEKDNEFGIYTAEFFHKLNGQDAHMTHFTFTPHKQNNQTKREE